LVVWRSPESVEETSAENTRDHEPNDDQALVAEPRSKQTSNNADCSLNESKGDVEENSLPSIEPEALDDERSAGGHSAFGGSTGTMDTHKVLVTAAPVLS
jgi:hypothetical protein